LQFPIPEAVKGEHEALAAALARAAEEPGEIGKAAREVERLVRPHCVREETFALPPIALLPQLARGEVTSRAEQVLPLTDRLQRELGSMLEEHKRIVRALERLLAAAHAAERDEHAECARRWIRHARTEEDVFYPAAVLAGRYIRLKLGMNER
jgi:hypothetical protein